MKPAALQRIFLRASIPRIRLTAVQPAAASDAEGEVWLGPRACWAAGFAEFEHVEVHNLTRGVRFAGLLRFGRERELTLTQPAGLLMLPGDAIRISAYVWLPEEAVARHTAIFVHVDPRNHVTEFHEVAVREIPLDPRSFPLPPPRVTVAVPPFDVPTGIPSQE